MHIAQLASEGTVKKLGDGETCYLPEKNPFMKTFQGVSFVCFFKVVKSCKGFFLYAFFEFGASKSVYSCMAVVVCKGCEGLNLQ